MAKLDMEAYRSQYLKVIEERLMAKKESIPHFTTTLLSDAIREEMNRADEETWEVEVPDDRELALKEAEDRILETMKHNFDLGVGRGAVTES